MRVRFELTVANGGDHGVCDREMTAIAHTKLNDGRHEGFVTLEIDGKRYELYPEELVTMLHALGHIGRVRRLGATEEVLQ